ncbi:hypothetical protein IT568_07595 [bacterium]|nr:hypothetical protein [bacterium]
MKILQDVGFIKSLCLITEGRFSSFLFKRIFFFLMLELLLINNSFGQLNFAFGVAPGSKINSAYLGLKMNNVIPFCGVEMLGISVSGSGEYLNYDYYSEKDKAEFSGNAFLIIPHFGAKLFMGTQNVKPYFVGNAFFSIPSASAKVEWWEYENNNLYDYGSEKLDPDALEDILSFWGITLGGGAEYFFSKNFSIGGEYGIRLLFNKIEYSKESEGYNYQEKWKSEVSANFQISYAVFTLNYYQ